MSNPTPARIEEAKWGSLNWRQVGVLYVREMRGALREKAIVLNSILIPVFLYPFLLWAAFTGLTFVTGQAEGLVSRVIVSGLPEKHPGLRLKLERSNQIQLIPHSDSVENDEQKIREGEVDALLTFLPPDSGEELGNNYKAVITYNQSQDRSIQAKAKLSDALAGYRAEWLRREARSRGIGTAEWQGFTISLRNVASGREIGAFIMGMVAPVIFVVMVAVGCFFPAVDATAGERERNTWETLMSTAASRANIVLAKYLYVASMGSLAGILNLLAVVLTLKPIFGPLLARTGRSIEYTLPLTALPLAAVAGLLLAGFVAAGMMIFAAFARTFKEGQSMIMPFYMLILVPIVFLQVPGLRLSFGLAFVPIVNLTLMVRQAVSGPPDWGIAAVTVAVSLALIAACLAAATFILRFEEVVLGTYGGGLLRFVKDWAFRRQQKKGAGA